MSEARIFIAVVLTIARGKPAVLRWPKTQAPAASPMSGFTLSTTMSPLSVSVASPTALFASTAWLADATPISHPLNQLLMECFKAILLQPAGEQPSELFQHSVQVDKKLGQLYYSKPEELCARAFEAFVQDATITNHFLVKGTKASPEAERGLYLLGAQREQINAAFSGYFSGLWESVRSVKTFSQINHFQY